MSLSGALLLCFNHLLLMRRGRLFCLNLLVLSSQAILLGRLPRTHEGEIFNYPQHFLIFTCLPPPLAGEGPKHSNPIMEMCLEIKTKLLSDAKLAVVIIQTFLGDSQHVCSFGEADFLSLIVMMGESLMQGAPLPDQLNGLPYGPFLTAALAGAAHALRGFLRVVSKENKSRVQKNPINSAGPILERKEGISRRVVYQHPSHIFRTMLGQKGGKIDHWRGEIKLGLYDE